MFENLSDRLERSFKLLKGQGTITEINVAETLKDIRRALLDADVNFKIAKQFTEEVKEEAQRMPYKVVEGKNGDAWVEVDPETRTVTGWVSSGNFCGYLDPVIRHDYYTLHFVAVFDIAASVREAYPDWDGAFGSGPFAEEHVAFDADGDLLLCRDVSVFDAPSALYRLELDASLTPVCDEIYALSVFGDQPFTSVARVVPELPAALVGPLSAELPGRGLSPAGAARRRRTTTAAPSSASAWPTSGRVARHSSSGSRSTRRSCRL